MMLQRKSTAVVALALFIAVSVAPQFLVASLTTVPALAQSPTPTSFPLPSTVPSGTTVRVDGSTSMAAINQALQQRFTEQYPGTDVMVDYQGSNAAIQAVLNGTADLAAIGRPLTQAERAQGLVAVPVRREKIAMIVGSDNPFRGNLSAERFAAIFRGEITNWSQVGGPSVPIRFVDRPEASDTREALRNYPVFKAAPFASGANAVVSPEDSTDAVIQALGTDGIGYAIVSQATNNPDVRIVSMHQTLPDDPRYPFSQPLA